MPLTVHKRRFLPLNGLTSSDFFHFASVVLIFPDVSERKIYGP